MSSQLNSLVSCIKLSYPSAYSSKWLHFKWFTGYNYVLFFSSKMTPISDFIICFMLYNSACGITVQKQPRTMDCKGIDLSDLHNNFMKCDSRKIINLRTGRISWYIHWMLLPPEVMLFCSPWNLRQRRVRVG